jgi:hypothetical protein
VTYLNKNIPNGIILKKNRDIYTSINIIDTR